MSKLTQKERDSLPAEHFAVPGKRALPIHDATHVRLAWDMVDRTAGLNDAERSEARKRIKRRAKQLGVDTSDWGIQAAGDGDNDADDGTGISKADAEYSAKGSKTEHCSICAHYESAEGNCQIVLGSVVPGGWCKYFAKGTPKRGVNAGAAPTTSMVLWCMALDVPTVAGHPNRMPFSGVLTKIGEPSDAAPHGSGGKRVTLTHEAAEAALPSLLGMGIDLTASLDGHNAQNKVGLITGAHIDGADLRIEGFIYAADFPAEALRIHLKQSDLGFSFEAMNLSVESAETDPLIINDLVFTGAAILMKNDAAYRSTSLAAQAALAQELDMTISLKEVETAITAALTAAVAPIGERLAALEEAGKQVTSLAASIDDLKKNPTIVHANTVTIEKVEPHAKALEAAALSCEAAGIGLHATRGHVAVLRRMAGHMRAAAATGQMPHEYNDGHSYWASAEQLAAISAAAAAAQPKVEDTEAFKTLKARLDKTTGDLAAEQQKMKDLQAAQAATTPGPERKTLSPQVSQLIAKMGIGEGGAGGDGKPLGVAALSAALDKAGIPTSERFRIKTELFRAGVVDPTAAN